MIKIEKKKDSIVVSGHAGYDDHGRDIVCSSVSSIIYTTLNGIKNINEKSIDFSDDNSKMIINIINKDDITMKLIDNMITLLDELAKQYPENIKISKGE